MKISDLKPAPGSTHRHKRVGRGLGSGSGNTSRRGRQGTSSRQGGQMPLQRRLPKRGFRRLQKNETRREEFAIVNLKRLAAFADGATVDAAALAARGVVPAGRKIKILGEGSLSAKLTVRADAFSASAREKIAAAGGTAEQIAPIQS